MQARRAAGSCRVAGSGRPPPSLAEAGESASTATSARYATPASAATGQDCSTAAPTAPQPATTRVMVFPADAASPLTSTSKKSHHGLGHLHDGLGAAFH